MDAEIGAGPGVGQRPHAAGLDREPGRTGLDSFELETRRGRKGLDAGLAEIQAAVLERPRVQVDSRQIGGIVPHADARAARFAEREALNRALLAQIRGTEWQETLNRYLGQR